MNLVKFLTPTTSKVFERTLFFNCRKLQYNTITTSTTVTILIENSEILLQLLINFPRYIFVSTKIAHENSFRVFFLQDMVPPKVCLACRLFFANLPFHCIALLQKNNF